MKLKLSYFISTLFALALCFNAEAQKTGYETITDYNGTSTFNDKNTLANKVSNNVWSITENGVLFTLSGDNSVTTNDDYLYLQNGSKNSTKNFTLSWSYQNHSIAVSNVEIITRVYSSDKCRCSIGSVATSSSTQVNNVVGSNTTVSSSSISPSATNVLISYFYPNNNSSIGSRQTYISSIKITYKVTHEEEILHTITISNGTTTSTSAGIDTQGTATAKDPQEGYEFLGWDIPNSVTLVSGYTSTYKTIRFYASENATITAKYGKIYDVTIANNVDATTSTVKSGTKTIGSYTAANKANYEFFEWSIPSNIILTSGTTKGDKSISFNAYAENLTVKAYYKPVFNFSASATSSNGDLGTATASVNDTKILGDVDATEMSTTATFKATPANDCVFKGWYEASDYSGEPVSTKATYNVTLTTTIGSTASKALYALFKKKQNLQWVDADLDLNLVKGQNYSSAATVTSGKTISYTTDNDQAVTIDANGTIHAVGLGDAHVTASVEGDDIYQSETITRDFSVGEIKQATFTPAWGEGTSTDIKVDGSTSIGLLNIANDDTFTITVGTPGVINVSRDGNTLNIAAVSAGTTTLRLSQTGNDQLAGNEVTYTITVSKYPNTFALADETKAMKVEEEWSNVITNQGNSNTSVSYSKVGIASFDKVNNKITALAEGSTVITFTQAATDRHEGITKTINVTVTKITNTLSVSLDNHELNVDGTLNLKITGQVNAGAILPEITDVQLSSSVNEGTEVITFENNIITAHNAGTAKIKFTQEATAKYTAYESDTYTITVNKISNVITVTLDGEQKNSKNVGRGATVALAYSSPSDGAYNINLTSGSNDIATISGYTITAGNTDGTNIWEITQAETYKYSAATATIRVKVNSVAEEEGYVFVGYTGKEESSVEFELSGPGKDIYLGARKSGVGNTTIQVRASTSDSWDTVKEFDTKYSLSGCESYSFFNIIPEDARYVRIYGSGSIHHFTDVKVTRLTYVRATATQTNLGEVYTDKTASASFNVSYSSTNGGNIEIISNNPRFKVDTENIEVRKAAFGLLPDPLANTQSITVDNNSDNVSDPVVVTVTYIPDPGHLGNDEGTFTISDRYYSAELTFTAFAKKYETSIGRGSNQATVTDVDGTIDNAFAFTGTSAPTPSADSNNDFYYTITSTYTSDVHTDEGVITYDPATNTITGRNAGTAKLTIYQKSTDNYAALSQTFEFSVNKLENPVSIALSTVSLEVDGEAAVQLTNDDGKGALSVAYSNIAYTNESMNREGGFLSYNAENETLTAINAGTATVTVTQAETYKYLSKSKQFAVTVDKLAQTLSWDREVETSLQIGAVIEGNTATSAQELSPVSYTSSNTAAIEVDGDTGKLTAKAVGSNITITASQAGNYKYAPATITRQFSVFNKQAPAFIPDEACYDSSTKTITVKWEGSTTISVTGVGSEAEAGFTITNGNDAVISVVRNESTITITGLSIGNTTLTLAQAANDDFLGKSETYTINVVMPADYLTLDPTAGFDLAEGGEYSKVFLHRTIPAGLNTIALPFNTTANALGAQKAYSFVNVGVKEKGVYYFYFKELAADETLTAGVPYVILCENTISELVISDTDGDGISVSSTEELQKVGTVNCGQWNFVANFSAGKDGNGIDMNGKYGVVNSAEPKRNEIMLGGEGSKLQAYTAYFILNQSSPSSYTSGTPASTKVASADIPAGAIPLFTVKE